MTRDVKTERTLRAAPQFPRTIRRPAKSGFSLTVNIRPRFTIVPRRRWPLAYGIGDSLAAGGRRE